MRIAPAVLLLLVLVGCRDAIHDDLDRALAMYEFQVDSSK
jgi:hypothetical protein